MAGSASCWPRLRVSSDVRRRCWRLASGCAGGEHGVLPPACTMNNEAAVRLILARILELQQQVDAGDVGAHLLRERIEELEAVLGRIQATAA